MPHLGVEGRALVAHLAHVAQHQQARGGQLGQHGNGRLHGIGVGVVGVVHQRQRAPLPGQGQRPAAPRHRGEGLQALGNRRQGHASRHRAGGGRQGIAHVVPPGNVQGGVQRAVRGGDAHLPMVALPHGVRRLHIAHASAKGEHRAPSGQALPQGGEGIVRREHGRAINRQHGQHAAVFFGHGLHGVHEFLVLALGVVHQGDGGLGNAGQVGNLAGVVHAQLDHAQAVLRGQAQQRQRHANRVVEIAARGKSGLARCGGQDAGQHPTHHVTNTDLRPELRGLVEVSRNGRRIHETDDICPSNE